MNLRIFQGKSLCLQENIMDETFLWHFLTLCQWGLNRRRRRASKALALWSSFLGSSFANRSASKRKRMKAPASEEEEVKANTKEAEKKNML